MSTRCLVAVVLALVVMIWARDVRADTTFLRSDVDESGSLEISDAIRIFRFLFLGEGGGVRCLDAADVDDDGKVTVTDGIASLIYLFQHGDQPPAPFPLCGPDPTEDQLACEAFGGCAHGFTYLGVSFEADGIFFVVDRSPPQSDNGTLSRVKVELERVISELPGHVQFGFGFFAKDLIKFPASGEPATATDEIKASATALVRGIGGGSGTCPQSAFAAMLQLAAASTARRRIVIYVGDGGGTCPGSDSEEAYLRTMVLDLTERNAGLARIYTLGARPCGVCEQFLQQLAEQNGGAYTRLTE